MGLLILPVMALIALAWLAITSTAALATWFVIRKFPLGRVLAPVLAAAVVFLCWYVPNMRAFAKQEQIDRTTADCGYVATSSADNVEGILIEAGRYGEFVDSFGDIADYYAPVEFRQYNGELARYDSLRRSEGPHGRPVPIDKPTQRYGIRVKETSTDILVRREEQVVDFTSGQILARNVNYFFISPPQLGSVIEIALYHLMVQPKICANVARYSREAQVPLVLRPTKKNVIEVQRR